MTSRLFDLDIVHPRGWGEFGRPGDACEHGHQITKNDIEKLKKHYGLEVSYHTINGNKYKLISLLHKDATDTVVSILGGDGKYYVMDSNNIPNGLIMPFFEHCKTNKLNLVIVDPDTALEHAWPYWIGALHQFKTKRIVAYFLIQSKEQSSPTFSWTTWQHRWAPSPQILENPMPITRKISEKYIIKNLITDEKLLIKYIKNSEKFIKIFSSSGILFNKTLSDLHVFVKDFKNILEYIKKLTNTNLWLMGHCSSAVMVSIIHDVNQYNHLYKGIILLAPWWKKIWREIGLDKMKYFSTEVNKPLLVIQHAEDSCVGIHPEVSKKIVNDINTSLTKYVELNGGIDQGCPHFSLGYHGFRGIEYKVINEINDFIQSHGKI
jgi:hypothetical protein